MARLILYNRKGSLTKEMHLHISSTNCNYSQIELMP